MTRLLLIAAGTLALTACSSELEVLEGSGDSPAAKIYNGTAPTGPEHEATVALHQLAKGGRSVYVQPFCSGTLIRGDVVLTAAHCMSGKSASKVAVFVGDEASTDPASSTYIWDHLYRASEASSHSGYSSVTLLNDIAILRLSSDAAGAEGVTPVPELPESLALSNADVGINLNFAGFGVTEVGSSGTKLQVDLPLGSMGCQVSGCPSSGNSSTQISYLQPSTDGGPCSGDSGGPAFVDRGGVTYLAGLTSYGDAGCTIYGVSTHTAPFETWIADFADPTADTGTSDSGGPGICELAAKGESCSVNADCCSDSCKGKRGAKTCR
jgi:secreted trypsin-like serine protease